MTALLKLTLINLTSPTVHNTGIALSNAIDIESGQLSETVIIVLNIDIKIDIKIESITETLIELERGQGHLMCQGRVIEIGRLTPDTRLNTKNLNTSINLVSINIEVGLEVDLEYVLYIKQTLK